VTVVDAQAPAIGNPSASLVELWPPDHRMVDVTIGYTVTDNCTPSSSIVSALSVTSNEPVNGTGDGDTAPDWEVVDSHHVRLRAERAGTGSGRIYRVTVTCTDGAGNSSQQAVTVRVPHSRN